MIIRNPINPYPHNVVIDPYVLKEEGEISFTFSGDRLGSYQLNVYSYSLEGGNIKVYNGKKKNINYAYNGDKISINFQEEDQQGIKLYKTIENTGEYYWEIIMSPFKNLETESEGDTGELFTSFAYVFESKAIPRIIASPSYHSTSYQEMVRPASFLINNKPYFYDAAEGDFIIDATGAKGLSSKNLEVSGCYDDGSIKYYFFQLEDENGNIIEKTSKIFSNKIEYKFLGLVPNQNYFLYFYSTSQKDQVLTGQFRFTTSYSIKNNINYTPQLTCNENETSITIEWAKDNSSKGKATGEYFVDPLDGSVNILSGEIIYDKIGSLPIDMNADVFAIGIKNRVKNNTGTIFKYINSNILYEVYIENYQFYLKYGYINSLTKNIQEISTPEEARLVFKENLVFGIIDEIPSENFRDIGYMIYTGQNENNEDYKISYSDSFYIATSFSEHKKYWILLQKDRQETTCIGKTY